MESLNFTNQIIANRGEKLNCIYKLTHGTVQLLNNAQQIIKTMESPFLLNIIQIIYAVPMVKTVKAKGRCHIKKISLKQSHKAIIKDLKQSGICKRKFKFFQEIHSTNFYELARFATIISLRKGQSLAIKDRYYYLAIIGNIIVLQLNTNIKIVCFQEGQIFCGFNNHTSFKADSQEVKIMEIHSSIVYAVLEQHQNKLLELAKCQKQIIQGFRIRNERVSHNIIRSRHKSGSKLFVPRHFTNVIEIKNGNLDQYCRAKSFFIQKQFVNKTKKEIKYQLKQDNLQKFKELMQINRKKYKRLQINDKIYSLSCTSTPATSLSPSRKKYSNAPFSKLTRSIYETNSIKQNLSSLNIADRQKIKLQRTQKNQENFLIKKQGTLVKKTKHRMNRPKNNFLESQTKQNNVTDTLRWKLF